MLQEYSILSFFTTIRIVLYDHRFNLICKYDHKNLQTQLNLPGACELPPTSASYNIKQ